MKKIHHRSAEHVNGNLTVAIDHQSWVLSIWYNEFLNNQQTLLLYKQTLSHLYYVG